MKKLVWAAVAFLMVGRGVAAANDATIPGAVSSPYPTLIHLSIEWLIQGDDNLNGVVTVHYREAGSGPWREGMPLRRVPAAKSRGARGYHWPNKHSGSLFDLQPDTLYEIRLNLEDPDGGSAEKTIQARTRPVPREAADAPVRRVNRETIGTAKPGEVLLLEPGFYGDFTATTDGEPGRPIVYRSPDGKAVFHSVTLRNRKYVYLEGVTVNGSTERTEEAQPAVELIGSSQCVVRRCTVHATWGIVASDPPGAANSYIVDNVVDGVSGWANKTMGAEGDNIGEGIQMTGSGNVIAFNRVTGFRDNISTMEGSRAVDQISVDIYNNDIYRGSDDGVEADFCTHNCRVVRNRLTNCYVGLSSQPGLGGPTYFIRNAMYNIVHLAVKLQRWSQGDVVLHNTVVKVGDGLGIAYDGDPFDFALFRNNLAIGGPNGGVKWGGWGAGEGRAVWLPKSGAHSSFDYDAVGSTQQPFRATINGKDFAEVEPHGLHVGLDVFDGVTFPNPPVPERDTPDLRPRAGSKVVDAAQRIPNINDTFAGAAPDIGAYEAGQPLPTYGPRPDTPYEQ